MTFIARLRRWLRPRHAGVLRPRPFVITVPQQSFRFISHDGTCRLGAPIYFPVSPEDVQ